MTSRVANTSVDCQHAYELSEWWKAVLDYTDPEGDPNLPDHPECMIVSRDGAHRILFIEVPDDKVVKNRLHFDLEPTSGGRDEELDLLLARGATQVADLRGQDGPGTGWVVLADPEGNEFCILRSPQERAAAREATAAQDPPSAAGLPAGPSPDEE